MRSVHVGAVLNIRAQQWVTVDSLRAGIRSALEEGLRVHDGWSFDEVKFLATEIVQSGDRARVTSIAIGVSLWERSEHDDTKNDACGEVEEILTAALVPPGPRLTKFQIVVGAVKDDGDEEQPFRAYVTHSDKPRSSRRHLHLA